MNHITFEIKSPEHAKLAAEFMGKFFALDNPESVMHYALAKEVKEAVQEEAAAVVAEQAIEKAAKPSPINHGVTIADIQAICSEKSPTVGAAAIKEAIQSLGADRVKDLPDEKLPELKALLESL